MDQLRTFTKWTINASGCSEVAAWSSNDSCAQFQQNNDNETSSGEPADEENPFILPWYFQLFYSVAFVAMVVVAAGGNLIVIWIVLAHKRMRTVTNYFLVNLAVADALISLLNTLFNYVYMLTSDWLFGRTYCKFTQFIAPCTISSSVFTFMAIALDRYIAIVQPMKPRMKAGFVVGVICVIWVASIALSSPNLLYSETYTWNFSSGDSRTVCYLEWPDGVYATTDFVYNVFFLIVTYFLPLLALAITYARVGKQLWGSQAIGERTSNQEETIRSKRRVVKMMIMIVVIFGICWLPQHAFFLVTNRHQEIQRHTFIQHVYLAIYWLAMSNSMYNPIIYCWMNARFRNGFKYVFRWLPWIKWRSCDVLGVRGTTKGRLSVSEGTKYTFTFNENDGGGGGSRIIGLRMHAVVASDTGLCSATEVPATTLVSCTRGKVGHAATAAAAARYKYRCHQRNKDNAINENAEL